MIADQSVEDHATQSLYDNYDKPLIRQAGGNKLKTNLLLALNRRQPYLRSNVVFLLTCSPHNTDVIDALTKMSLIYHSDEAKKLDLNPINDLYLDMALSELGQPKSRKRIQAIIERGDITLVPDLLDHLKFVDTVVTLKSLLLLLKDKRMTQSGITIFVEPPVLRIPPGQDPDEYRQAHPVPPSLGPHTDYFRVCDLALPRLAEKTGVDIGIPDLKNAIQGHWGLVFRHYTDAELNVAYNRLTAYFHNNLISLLLKN